MDIVNLLAHPVDKNQDNFKVVLLKLLYGLRLLEWYTTQTPYFTELPFVIF